VGNTHNVKNTLLDPFLFLLVSATAILVAAGYIINDYYDVKIDSINNPQKVIVGRFIKRRYAIVFHSLLNFIAILIGALISWKICALFFLVAFSLWLYSNLLKRHALIGNLIVSLLTALSISIIGIYFAKNQWLINAYAGFAFFISLIREIVKDLKNKKGDERHFSKTLPIVLGLRKSKVIIYVIIGVFLCILAPLVIKIDNLNFTYYCIFMIIPFGFFTVRLVKADTRQEFRFLNVMCKLIMVLGILSMVFFK